MQPDEPVPDILRKQPPPNQDGPDVGEFRQGTAFSQAALARFLVGRAIVESVGSAMLIIAVIVVLLAVAAQVFAHSTVLAVLIALVAVAVLVMRWVVLAVVRRLTGFARFGPLEDRMRALVDDTRSDVLRELRRIGLPGRTFTLPLLAFRFVGTRRRADTVAKLRTFDVERAVPKARLDELHIVLKHAWRGGLPPESGPTAR